MGPTHSQHQHLQRRVSSGNREEARGDNDVAKGVRVLLHLQFSNAEDARGPGHEEVGGDPGAPQGGDAEVDAIATALPEADDREGDHLQDYLEKMGEFRRYYALERIPQ